MLQLIYHSEKSLKETSSPFDKVIFELVKGNSIKVVCPYIGLSYFKRIIGFSDGNWLLLTDVNEWVNSQRRKKSRNKIQQFILENNDRIRHCSNLHAKAIITTNKIFLGSSNFTLNGITKNNELSVVIDNQDKAIELNSWFQEWWKKSKTVSNKELARLIVGSNEIPKIKEDYKIKNKNTKINSGLFSLPYKNLVAGTITEQELAHYLSIWANREWANNYFNLMKELIEYSGLDNSDNRFAITVRRKKTGKSRIPVIIGRRYVLAPFYDNDTEYGIGLIIGLNYNLDHMEKDGVIKKYQERVFSGEGGFTQNKKLEAHWLVFDRKQEIHFSEEIKYHWKEAIEKELKRTKYSRFRPNHQPIIYDAVVDLEYRKEIFDLAFAPTVTNTKAKPDETNKMV